MKNEMIRTGQFSDAFIPIMDGVTVCMKNYAEYLSRNGQSCTVVTSSFPDHLDTGPYQVLRYGSFPLLMRPPYRFGFPKLDLEFMYRLWRTEFHLVHAHSPFFAGQLALDISRHRNIPIIATFHSKYRDDLFTQLPVKPLVDIQVRNIVKFYESVDAVWVPNRATAGTLREYGFSGDVEVVENGCDMKPDEDVGFYRAQGNRILGTGDRETVLLFVGQIILEKNLDLLVKVLSVLKSRGKAFRMFFVGEGYARKQLEEYVEQSGLADRVRFIGLVTDRELLKACYARADLFLFPSVYDNAPLVVKEVSAFQVPSVLIRGSNAAENVIHGRNGFLAENSVEAYAETVMDILDRRSLRETVGERARAMLYRSWEDVVSEVAGRYREILRSVPVSF